jgi:hypothetical protein
MRLLLLLCPAFAWGFIGGRVKSATAGVPPALGKRPRGGTSVELSPQSITSALNKVPAFVGDKLLGRADESYIKKCIFMPPPGANGEQQGAVQHKDGILPGDPWDARGSRRNAPCPPPQ